MAQGAKFTVNACLQLSTGIAREESALGLSQFLCFVWNIINNNKLHWVDPLIYDPSGTDIAYLIGKQKYLAPCGWHWKSSELY